MLADERAKSLVEDFAFQWLDVAKLDEIVPDRGQFPHASGLLDPARAHEGGAALFVDSVLRSDRSVVELLTADYTYLNERLAMHYGIETVKGARFREVTLPDESRYGLLGKGAVLMLTAYPNRTSPVLRGAWIQERLRRLAAPAPPPPTCRISPTTNAASRRGRCVRGSSSTARIRPASPATASWIRSASRSRTSTPWVSFARLDPGHAHADRRERHAARRNGRQQAPRTCAGRSPRTRTSSCRR